MDKVTGQCPQTTAFWRERRAESVTNQGPSTYQPNTLPLGQTGLQSQLPQPVLLTAVAETGNHSFGLMAFCLMTVLSWMVSLFSTAYWLVWLEVFLFFLFWKWSEIYLKLSKGCRMSGFSKMSLLPMFRWKRLHENCVHFSLDCCLHKCLCVNLEVLLIHPQKESKH